MQGRKPFLRGSIIAIVVAAALFGIPQTASAAKVEKTHWHSWQNLFSTLENWIRSLVGASKVAVGLHNLRVWGNTDDNCTFTSYGADNSKSFDDLLTGLDLSKSARPILTKKASAQCAELGGKAECAAYTSDYKVYLGISVKGFDLSIKVATSSITLRVCADGTKSIEDESRDP